ncbi:MAG: hypothetical protein ACHREM_01205 [Polyangiales bacterium]
MSFRSTLLPVTCVRATLLVVVLVALAACAGKPVPREPADDDAREGDDAPVSSRAVERPAPPFDTSKISEGTGWFCAAHGGACERTEKKCVILELATRDFERQVPHRHLPNRDDTPIDCARTTGIWCSTIDGLLACAEGADVCAGRGRNFEELTPMVTGKTARASRCRAVP